MLQPVDFKVGEDDYQLLPHTGFTVLNLDRKVLGLFGAMYSDPGAVSEDTAFVSLAAALDALSASDYRWLVETTLSRVTVVTEGKKHVSLSDMDAVSAHFAGQMQNLYAVVFEVWRRLKLSPFAEAPAGN